MMKTRTKRIAVWVNLFCLAGVVSAATVVVDFNDMNKGRLYDQAQPANTGEGFFTEYWTVNTSVIQIKSGDLVPPEGVGYQVTQSGTPQHLTGIHASADRRQARKVEPIAGYKGPIWFSFLVQNKEETDATGIDFRLSQTATDPTFGPQMIYLIGNSLFIGGMNEQTVDLSEKISLGETVVVIGKLIPGDDELTIWVNPAAKKREELEQSEPDFSGAQLGWNMTRISVLGLVSYDTGPSGSGGKLDNVRISNEKDAYSIVTGN